MEIRTPLDADAAAISECIRSSSELSQMTDGSREGASEWNALVGQEAIAARIRSGELSRVVCKDGLIVGYIAYRSTSHLSLLFVRKSYQGQGIGRRLVRDTVCRFSEVTVNSTDLAVPFYEKMGFRISGERFLKRGAWSTPMKWTGSNVGGIEIRRLRPEASDGETRMRKIEVVDYDPLWPKSFESEKTLLAKALGPVAIKVHHIGSTAVPGLAAKPVIDILVEVRSLSELDALGGEMEAIGYAGKGECGISGRRHYQKGGHERTHHVHAFVVGDDHLARHIAFRDYLRSSPAVAEEYAALKRKAAGECGNDMDRYCEGKDAFVKHHQKVAMRLWRPD